MTPLLPMHIDPAEASPAERARAVAAILAEGLRRLRNCPASPPILATQNSQDSTANELDVAGDTSVTVNAVNTAETQRFPGDRRW
jgi:hypothetical protein